MRAVGIDIGAETLKVVELVVEDGAPRWTRREIIDHAKDPAAALIAILQGWDWAGVGSAAISGRLARGVDLPVIPIKQAQAAAFRFLHGDQPVTIVSIGNHGFSVLELRGNGVDVLRENGRCSQGTGNFLRQLVERFGLSVEEASALCVDVPDPAPLSGRCPVILKTDMTHLANKGENRARILAGLYDAVCENVQVLIKPRVSSPNVMLIGGVARAERVRAHFRRYLGEHGMSLLAPEGDEYLYYEALGCALAAAERPTPVRGLDALLRPLAPPALERVPALAGSLASVRRMTAPPAVDTGPAREIFVGLDIGSTGSKAVAMDADRQVIWQAYRRTGGDPVGAAQALVSELVASSAGRHAVLGYGVTGSGREIVGSLLATCYGGDAVFILNEIAAHAEGALHHDPSVDTIFEIGGQDAKYIRLAGGRVVDAAMNEACSAGTGSFIEEQGRRFADIPDVAALGKVALESDGAVSLGQHCSVFMAEVIDEAIAAGVERPNIVAGIYDSIVQNYLNRVKGSRSVGEVIFCQGMPFTADALAAGVARQTGVQVIVPPDPGTVGALGIALLAQRQLEPRAALAPARFLEARVTRKDTFICKSTVGCGGSGNYCRIDRLTTMVSAKTKTFTWGGGCSLFDKGTRKRKLPDRAPDPFRERDELMTALLDALPRGYGPRVAIAEEFQLKGLFPFFATFLAELGCTLEVHRGADHAALKRGIEGANVPFCAPMQQAHGLASKMAETRPDALFLPMVRSLPKAGDEPYAVTCPIVQGSPDVLRLDLGARVFSPIIDIGADGLESPELARSCEALAASLGCQTTRGRIALRRAIDAQVRFDERLVELGRGALAFAKTHDVVPVVVLGRPYTIYNTVLNSNVPALLREQGALAIPVDCYPIGEDVPVFRHMYWAHGQRILRAAHDVRRNPGVYSVYCSNYSCGPDSFNLHFYAYLMDGKPFAVIETDGHSGDAGTKTRLEAFLHCVREDLAEKAVAPRRPRSLKIFEADRAGLADIRRRGEHILIPRMGPGAEAFAACLRGTGVRAEALPLPDRDTVRAGRRHTSGKECVPMCITAGSLLQRLEREPDPAARFAFFMPTANGPCRFGVYHLLHRIILERTGFDGRVRIWAPSSSDYFEGVPAGFAVLAFTAFMASDLLLEALHHTRPVERQPGAAQRVYARHEAELYRLLERAGAGDLSVPAALLQVATGRLFGVTDLLRRASRALAGVADERPIPTVLVVGEIYVRLDPFANDFIVDKLERRGIRARLAPFNEWLEYSDRASIREGEVKGFAAHLSSFVRAQIQARCYSTVAEVLGWPPRTSVGDTVRAAAPYMREALVGEAVLTIGGPLHEHAEGIVDGVISVGPLECMPSKLAETQLQHAAEKTGIVSITIPVNGDPIDPAIIDGFAYAVHARFRQRPAASPPHRRAGVPAALRAMLQRS